MDYNISPMVLGHKVTGNPFKTFNRLLPYRPPFSSCVGPRSGRAAPRSDTENEVNGEKSGLVRFL